MSIRQKTVLEIRKQVRGSTSLTALGGKILLAVARHALDGPEHTGQLPTTRLSTADTTTTDVLSPDGAGGVLFRTGHTHVWNEPPSGIVDGTNGVFDLAAAPSPDLSLMLYRNGLLMLAGAGNDYTLAGATITFQTGNEPSAGAVLVASYTT
jgi:hypothetical protein